MRKFIFFVTLLLAGSALYSLSAQEKEVDLNIVFIGNSITQGVQLRDPQKEAPPVKCARWLQEQPGIGNVDYFNGGRSGCTTVDYLPEQNNLFLWMKEQADRLNNNKGLLIFSVMLGTNDSAISGPKGAPVEPSRYRENLVKIVDEILRLYPRALVVLNAPLWYSPNTYNRSMYLVAGQKRLLSYFPELENIVKEYGLSRPGRVKMGDTDAYVDFKENYLTDSFAESGQAGIFYLHPNEKGGTKLAEHWGKAILKAIGK